MAKIYEQLESFTDCHKFHINYVPWSLLFPSSHIQQPFDMWYAAHFQKPSHYCGEPSTNLLLMNITLLWSCWYSLLLHSYFILYKLRNQIWNCLLSPLFLYILMLLIHLFSIAVVPQIIEQIESFIMQWRLSVNKMVIENENELVIG